MRLSGAAQLTYCTNVHAGESWAELRDEVLPRVVEVKERLAWQGPFGVGLRVSARAADELRQPGERSALSALLARHGLYVFTLNGFPYGNFHGGPVKAAVYEPDWRSEARLAYSDALAELLAELLPAELTYGSISSVPLGFRANFQDDAAWEQATEQLLRHVAQLHRLALRTGRRIVLALEPEPGCALETTDDCLTLFARWLRSERALARLSALLGPGGPEPRRVLAQHLGLCVDACHAAVEFEEPTELVTALRQAEIPIYKAQLSAGLRVPALGNSQLSALTPFAEDVYLHQVVTRGERGLTRYLDLGEAIAQAHHEQAKEWRIHFHVPIFAAELGQFSSTQPFLRALCGALQRDGSCEHFEVETYTWSVLPAFARGADLIDDVANELRWVLRESALGGRSTP